MPGRDRIKPTARFRAAPSGPLPEPSCQRVRLTDRSVNGIRFTCICILFLTLSCFDRSRGPRTTRPDLS